MAEILLSGVLRKLAAFSVEKVLELSGVKKVIENVQSLYEIAEEVKELKEELSWIRALIKDADKRSIVDETKKKWVMDLIEVAYDLEDAVDIFLLKCPLDDSIKTLPKKVSELPFLYNFQNEMQKIRKRVSRIHERGKNYNANNLGEVTQSSISGHKLNPIGDPEVIGFDKDIKNIVEMLCDQNIKKRAVVSIVGPGGLGKTTLAQKVRYSEKVRSKFRKPTWVTISQNYDLLDVLKRIAKSFGVRSTDLDANEIAEKIREHLMKRKYLIVLDDVWTKQLCNDLLLKGVLPENKNGSRVLITTRDIDVARYAHTTYEPYQLNFLNPDESLKLFLKNAIPDGYQYSDGLSPNLNELAKKFIMKCKGLPLALIVLGRLLSTKTCNYHEWNKLLKTMSWREDGTECRDVIATSFEHLPFERKFCFMYFAAFPEDQEIEAQPLLRMWVAEGLIPPEELGERRKMEQTAERFLEDLVHRSMVQVSKRYPDGSIKYLVVHDVLRDIAIHKAEESKFLVVCSKKKDWESSHCTEARRVAVHYSNFNESMKQYANPKLRSLIIFGESKLDCSNYSLLRVLANMDNLVGLQCFPQLPHLRYFQLNSKDKYVSTELSDLQRFQRLFVSQSLEQKADFGIFINAMESLETLDLRSSYDGDLTHWIWQIQSLRHVQLSYSPYNNTEGPPASANLPNLQTIRGVRYSKSWETSGLPDIPEVRELDIQLDSPDQWEVTAALLLKQKDLLVDLSMSSKNFQIQNFEGVFPDLENIKCMEIKSTNRGSTLELIENMFPPNLLELHLEGFEIKSDPMPVLEKLGSLKSLTINKSNRFSEDPLTISCSARGFKQLEELTLDGIKMLQQWKIELGAMPLLKCLKVSGCDMLPVPIELMDLKSLRDFHWSPSNITDVKEANVITLDKIFNEHPNMRKSVDAPNRPSFCDCLMRQLQVLKYCLEDPYILYAIFIVFFSFIFAVCSDFLLGFF